MNEREIFQKALEISDADKRQAFLNVACGANTSLRASVASLLASHAAASDFLINPALEQIPPKRVDGIQPTMQFGFDKTSPNAFDLGADDDELESDQSPNLSFLEPSTKPGSLGTLGHYEVLELLGQGGFGVVFKAFDEKLHRLVAIKTMDQQMASTSPPRKRFLREARSAAAIKNDNIVQVYSVEERPLPYLVMEFVDGATLQDKLDDFGPIDVRELLHLARQMASGLAAAHAQGLIHRDIKPGNILIEAGVEQKIKITDFGLARAADDASLTRSGMISGTPLYMAPEQALGQAMDQRTDLFSLGSVLYQMACGRPPFRAPTTLAVLRRVADDTPRPLQEIAPEIPDWLAVIINRLLEKKPEDRFQTSKELADLLAKCQSELLNSGQVTCVDCSHLSRDAASSASAIASGGSSPKNVSAAIKSTVATSPSTTIWGKSRRLLVAGSIAALVIAAVFLLNSRRNIESEDLASGEHQPATLPSPSSQISNPATQILLEVTDLPIDLPINFAVERKAAERLMRLGKGKMILGNKDRQLLGELKEPLPLEPFCILTANFQNVDLTDDELGVIAGCAEITQLDLFSNRRITSTGLNALSSMRALRTLNLAYTAVNSDALKQLSNWPRMQHLDLNSTQLDDAGLENLAACSELQFVDVGGTKVTDEGLAKVALHCPNLHQIYLGIGGTGDGARTLSPLKPLRLLRSVRCSANQVTAEGVDVLRSLPQLEHIGLNSPTSDEAVELLAALGPKLRSFECMGWAGWDAGLTESGYASLQRCRDLTNLNFSGISGAPTDQVLLDIVRLPDLQSLRIVFGESTRKYTANGVAKFRELRPDVLLEVDGQTYPALSDWPGKFEGSTSTLEWNGLGEDAPTPTVAPFSADDAKQKQAEWAKYLRVEPDITNAAGMKFRLIPPSEAVVDIGTPEQPRLALQRVSTPYYLGATEVTVGQFQQFVAATTYQTDAERLKNGHNLQGQPDSNANWKTPGYPISDDLPVNFISPADAKAFCDWLNTQSEIPNLKSEISNHKSLYRLPTELEWELASRAGGAGNYAFAGNAQGVLDYAWTAENVAGKPTPVQPVATKLPNPFGLHDVLGNVSEWYTTEQGLVRGVVGSSAAEGSSVMTIRHRVLGTQFVQPNVGFRVLKQLQPSSPAPRFAEQPVLTPRNVPLGPQANVTCPAPIPGLRSWTIELAAHLSLVDSIAWSPQGNVIATTGHDMSVRLWDRDGKLKSILLGHIGVLDPGRSITFSPDGSRLATVDRSTDFSHPSTLRIWDVSGLSIDSSRSRETPLDPANPELSQVRLLAVVPLRSWGLCVAWSPNGKQIAYGGTMGMCEILDVATGQVRLVKVESDVASLAWSADSRTLCMQEKGVPVLFDAIKGDRLAALTSPDMKPAETSRKCVAWSPDGRWIAAESGKQVRLWDAATRTHLRTIPVEFDAGSLAWHKESQFLAITPSVGGLVFVFDTASGDVAAQSPAIGGSHDVAWSPDGTELVAHNGLALRFLDGKTGKVLRSGPNGGLNGRMSSVLSSDGKHLYSKDTNAPACLQFDAETGQFLERRKAPLGQLLATASDDRWRAYLGYSKDPEVIIEPTRFDRDPVTITTPGTSFMWRSDPSGERIAQAFGEQVRIWEASTGQPLGTLPHSAKLRSFEWSPDGQQIATAADDKTIRLWDTKTNKVTAEFKQFPQDLSVLFFDRGNQILAWTRDGRSLWIPLGQHAGLLNLSTGRVAPVENFSNGNLIDSLTMASDGDRLLAREAYGWTFFRDRDGSRQLLGQYLGARPQWHLDNRRFLSGADTFGVRGFDVSTRRRLGTLWPDLTGDHWLCVGPTGHYRGSPGVEEQFVYVAELDDGGHITLFPANFATRFGWKNDPDKATLLKLNEVE